MSAQAIVADFVRKRAIPCPSDVDPDAIYFDNGHARELIDALHAAGYRLIGPGELDRETIERCAEVADGAESENRTRRSAAAKSKPDDCAYYLWAEHQAKAIAIVLRSLQGGDGNA